MGSLYLPVQGQIRILETNSYRQYPLPIAPREIKSGDLMWLLNIIPGNGVANAPAQTSWVEPAINSPSGYTYQATYGDGAVYTAVTQAIAASAIASTSASLAAEQEAFAALFAGISQAHRTPRSYSQYLQFGVPGTNNNISYDSSAPYITVVTSGIADFPYYDGTYNAVPSGFDYPIGWGITPSGWVGGTAAGNGFTDASGVYTGVTAKYYCYNNSVMMTNFVGNGTHTLAAASIIGRLVKRAKAGDSTVRAAFSSYLSVPASGQVAGVMLG